MRPRWTLGLTALLALTSLQSVINVRKAPPASGTQPLALFPPTDPRIRIDTVPYTITQCGSYFLGGCLQGVAGNHGIEVQADDVTIDMNGFTLTGVSGSDSGIAVVGAHTNLLIFGGTVRNWDNNGIDAFQCTNAQFHDLRLSGNRVGLRAGAGSIVRDCTSRDNTELGFFLNDVNGTIRNCVSAADGTSGNVGAAGIAVVADCLVEGCTVDNSFLTGIGIRVDGSGNTVRDSHVTESATGFQVQGVRNHVFRNTYESSVPGRTAFDIGSGNTVGTIFMTAQDPIGAVDPWANFGVTP